MTGHRAVNDDRDRDLTRTVGAVLVRGFGLDQFLSSSGTSTSSLSRDAT